MSVAVRRLAGVAYTFVMMNYAAVAGLFVSLFAEGYTLNNIFEFYLSRNFSNDYIIKWIPCADDLTFFNLLTILHQ